ncbi:unnamed protein product [Pedinophyceae sp. YPF-701]|nr:unnamed protein product [Pedinophyceae sp. YPF-701]
MNTQQSGSDKAEDALRGHALRNTDASTDGESDDAGAPAAGTIRRGGIRVDRGDGPLGHDATRTIAQMNSQLTSLKSWQSRHKAEVEALKRRKEAQLHENFAAPIEDVARAELDPLSAPGRDADATLLQELRDADAEISRRLAESGPRQPASSSPSLTLEQLRLLAGLSAGDDAAPSTDAAAARGTPKTSGDGQRRSVDERLQALEDDLDVLCGLEAGSKIAELGEWERDLDSVLGRLGELSGK